MTFYYNNQTRSQAESLMEKQHYPVLEEAASEEPEEEFCFYCGEPLEDGMCSAACRESADDEGRLEDCNKEEDDEA